MSLSSTEERELSGVENTFFQLNVFVLLPAGCFTDNCVLAFYPLTIHINAKPGFKTSNRKILEGISDINELPMTKNLSELDKI